MDSIHEEISQGSTLRRLLEIIYGPILKVRQENAFGDCQWNPNFGNTKTHRVERSVSRSLKQRDSCHWWFWRFSQFCFWFHLWRRDDVWVTKYSRRFSNSDSTFNASRFWKYEINYRRCVNLMLIRLNFTWGKPSRLCRLASKMKHHFDSSF